jgi:hypothetical protein
MISTAEASSLVRRLASPAPVGDTTKAAISRAHRTLKTWTWNRVRDVWHADPRIRVSADELDQLRNLVLDRKNPRGTGAAWDDTLGFMERIAAIEDELRELRALISLLPDKAFGRPPLGVGRAAQELGIAPPRKQDRAEGRGVAPHHPEPIMDGAVRPKEHGKTRRGGRLYRPSEALDPKLEDPEERSCMIRTFRVGRALRGKIH